MKEVIIYTDGACSGNPGQGGYGAVMIYGDTKKTISGYEAYTTNNRMELLAVIRSLQMLKHECRVTLYSDSAYVVNAIKCKWLDKWQANGWKSSSHKHVQNKDLWEELAALLKVHEVVFRKVKGHADNEYNNQCDSIARNAIVNKGA